MWKVMFSKSQQYFSFLLSFILCAFWRAVFTKFHHHPFIYLCSYFNIIRKDMQYSVQTSSWMLIRCKQNLSSNLCQRISRVTLSEFPFSAFELASEANEFSFLHSSWSPKHFAQFHMWLKKTEIFVNEHFVNEAWSGSLPGSVQLTISPCAFRI